MSDTARPDESFQDDDLLAAEYALRLLPEGAQAELALRRAREADFARRVAEWEERLSPLSEGFTSADLPQGLKEALDLRLFGPPAPKPGFWSGLALWRGLTGAATAAFLLALALPALQPAPAQDRLAATLTAEGSSLAYLVLYDAATGRVSLAHRTGEPVGDRVLELWIARGAEAPVSLGVIPAGVSTEVTTTEVVRRLMSPAAHMAISLEPPGGSPTGQPTGPVLAVGDLLDI